MAEWGKVKDILALKRTSATTPHPGDSTALIPHTFITIIRKLRDARLKLVEHQKSDNADGTDNTHSIAPSLLREVAAAVQELHAHFEKLVSDEEKLKEAMRGHEKDCVLWVEPNAQRDFVQFISSLCDQYGASSGLRPDVSELIEWALDVQIDDILDDTGLEQAAEACLSVEGAFKTFQAALENMLRAQEDLMEKDDVAAL